MSDTGTTAGPSVDWDAGVGILTIRADGLAPHAQRATVIFHSRVWILLDDHGQPTAADILDVPEIMARVVPRARHIRDGEPDATGAIPWLIDPDSDWVWIRLGDAPERSRLVREGRVEVWLSGDLPLRVRVWAPMGGTADRDGRRPG